MTKRKAWYYTALCALVLTWQVWHAGDQWLRVLGGIGLGWGVAAMWAVVWSREDRERYNELKEQHDELTARFEGLAERYAKIAASARRLAGKRGLN